jgi:CubicO group peptidase (beta-lactamase class C family)
MLGFDRQRLARVREVLKRGIEEKSFPGGVYGIQRHGETVALEAFGLRDTDPEAPATVNTLYDMASVTKPVCCATPAMILMEQGRLHTGEEARSFFPEFSLPHWAGITIHHLLTHTSGLPDWKALHADGLGEEAALKSIFACEMKAAPGTKYEYSCLGYITLGKILERVAGEPLDTFTKREIFEPLNMEYSGYRRISATSKAGPGDDVAPTIGSDLERGKLYGEVHDGNAGGIDGISGNAGLFSTAADMLRFGQMLLNGGELDGVRVLCPRTVARMLNGQIDKSIGGQTWGLFCAPSGMHPAGDILWEGSAAHTGFTGTSLLVHPGLELVVVLLTNRVLIPNATHSRARRLFHNAVGAAIVE